MAHFKFFKNLPLPLGLFLSFLPIIILFFFVNKYSVNFPFSGDEWLLIEFIEKYYNGNLTLFDFWKQIDEHRPFFATIISVFLMIFTKFNVIYAMYFIIFLAFLNLLIVMHHISKHADVLNFGKHHRLLWVASSVFIFSLVQVSCWLWGLEIHIFLNMLSVICGAYIFSSFSLTPYSFTGLVLCGLVATFTRGNGYAYWVSIFCFLIIFKFLYKRKIQTGYIILWFLSSVLVLSAYLYDYHPTILTASLSDILKDPLTFCYFVIKFIGCPVAFYHENISGNLWTRSNHADINCWGAIGVTLYIILLTALFFQKSFSKAKVNSFYYIIALYVIISGFITSMGRVSHTLVAATASRYTSTTIYFWLSIFFLLITFRTNIENRKIRERIYSFVINMTCLSIFIATLMTSYYSSKSFPLEKDIHLGFYSKLPQGICLDNEKEFFLLYVTFMHKLQVFRQSIFMNRNEPPVFELFHENLTATGSWSPLVRFLPALDFNVSASLTSKSDSDIQTGSVKSNSIFIIPLSSPYIKIQIIHGRDTKNQKIGIRLNSDPSVELVCDLNNTADSWSEHTFDLSKYSGNTFTFFADDNGAGEDEWLGFFIPIAYYKN